MLIDEIMTGAVVTTEPSHSVASARDLMREGRFRHLPVVDNGRMVGIISDRDIGISDRGVVRDVMHAPVISVSCTTPVEIAAQLMVDNKIGALPVVDDGSDRPVGIVSQTDLFVVLAKLLGANSPSTRLELQVDDLPRDLAAIATAGQRHQVGISSLVVLPDDVRVKSGPRRLILRIGTMLAAPFVAELRAAGIVVDSPELH